MYPLSNWSELRRGYRFMEKTTYSKHHLGLDLIAPRFTPVYAPFTGEVKTMIGKEGGNTVWFFWDNFVMRILHLSKFGKTGKVKEGDIIGYVGSTGTLSTGNHAHLDISKNRVDINNINNFINPETFSWQKENDNNKIDMTLEELKKIFVQKDERFTFYPNGKPAIVNNSKQYFPDLGDMGVIYMKFARPIREVETKYPETKDRREVLG